MGAKRNNVKRAVRKAVKWGGAGLNVLVAVVWIGSCWCEARCSDESTYEMYLSSGMLCVIYEPGTPVNFRAETFDWSTHQPSLAWWFYGGVFNKGRYVAVPLWPAALLSLIATAAAWRADLKHIRRARAGLCGSCGYDRAGLPKGGLCPECGAA